MEKDPPLEFDRNLGWRRPTPLQFGMEMTSPGGHVMFWGTAGVKKKPRRITGGQRARAAAGGSGAGNRRRGARGGCVRLSAHT